MKANIHESRPPQRAQHPHISAGSGRREGWATRPVSLDRFHYGSWLVCNVTHAGFDLRIHRIPLLLGKSVLICSSTFPNESCKIRVLSQSSEVLILSRDLPQ